MCCKEIEDNKSFFLSTHTKERFEAKYHLNCQSQYVIYLIQCDCGLQYVGRTMQRLHCRMNKHRANIRNSFLLQSVSRHLTIHHKDTPNPFKVMPIDWIPPYMSNRFESLRKLEIYWMFQLQTLRPYGLN